MLLTLTSLSGFYCFANTMLVKRNKNLLKYNLFLSIRGKKSLGQITIIKDFIPHHINYIRSNQLSIEKFSSVDEIYHIQNFNTTEECKNFCINKNLKFDYSFYNKVFIDEKNTENIWIIYNSNEYTIVRNMSTENFKNQIIKNNQLPFNRFNIILFIVLLVICYESNLDDQNNISKFIKLKMIKLKA